MERLDRLKEKAEWHEDKAKWYIDTDIPYSNGAAQYHSEQAKTLWNEYGRLVAQLESKKQWNGKGFVVLVGEVIG